MKTDGRGGALALRDGRDARTGTVADAGVPAPSAFPPWREWGRRWWERGGWDRRRQRWWERGGWDRRRQRGRPWRRWRCPAVVKGRAIQHTGTISGDTRVVDWPAEGDARHVIGAVAVAESAILRSMWIEHPRERTIATGRWWIVHIQGRHRIARAVAR